MRYLGKGLKLEIWLFLLIVIAINLYMRLPAIIGGNFGFTFDQGRDMLAAVSIANGKFTLIGPTTGLAGLFHGPLWYYILALLSFLGGGNPKTVVALIAVIYLCAELVLFFVIKKFYGSMPAFVFFIFISISPLFVAQNQQFWSPYMASFSMIFISAALILIANGKNAFLLLGLALGTSLQFEMAGGLFSSVAIFLTLLAVRPPKVKANDYFKILLGFLITLVSLLAFEVRHGFLMVRSVLSHIGNIQADFVAEYGSKTMEYKTGLFLDLFNKSISTYSIVVPLLLLLAIFVFCLKWFLARFEVSRSVWLVVVWNFCIIFLIWSFVNFYRAVVWPHFLLGIPTLIIVSITFLIYAFSKYFPKTTILLCLLLFSYMIVGSIVSHKSPKGDYQDASYYKNQVSLINEIYTDSQGAPFNVVIYTPPVFSYSYDYLFSWYGLKRFGRLPVDNSISQQLVYYIIEPDNIEGRKEKWLKEREGDGKIIFSRFYWGDPNPANTNRLTLQKRIRAD